MAGYSPSAWVCTGGTQSGTQVTLALGQSASCSITNTDIAQLLKVVKVLIPSTDTGRFNLTIDGTHYISSPNDPAGNGDATGFIPVIANAQHTAGETAVSPAVLTDYVTTYGGNCDSSGHITLGLAASATCTSDKHEEGHSENNQNSGHRSTLVRRFVHLPDSRRRVIDAAGNIDDTGTYSSHPPLPQLPSRSSSAITVIRAVSFPVPSKTLRRNPRRQ